MTWFRSYLNQVGARQQDGRASDKPRRAPKATKRVPLIKREKAAEKKALKHMFHTTRGRISYSYTQGLKEAQKQEG